MNRDTIEDYLDGRLAPADLEAFGERLRGDAELRGCLVAAAAQRRALRRGVQERCGSPRGSDGVVAAAMRLMAMLRRQELGERECRRLEVWLGEDRELQRALARRGGFERELHEAVGTRALEELLAAPPAAEEGDAGSRIEAYLDGSLGELELIDFEADLAAEPALRRHLLAAAGLERQLPSAVRARVEAETVAPVAPIHRPAGDRPGRSGPRPLPIGPRRQPRPGRWSMLPAALAGLVFLAAIGFTFLPEVGIGGDGALAAATERDPDAPVVSAYGSGARLERAGDVLPFVSGGDGGLRDGDRVAVPPGGNARLHFGDGTTVDLAGGSRVRWLGGDRGKHLALEHGELVCAAAPQQRAEPLRLELPGGRVQVLGTVFRSQASEDGSRVAVEAGRVAVSTADGQRLELAAGEQVAIDQGRLERIVPHSDWLGFALADPGQWQDQPPLVDLVLTADGWMPLGARRLQMRDDGWVARLRSDQQALLALGAGRPLPAGVYTLRYRGQGELRVRNAGRIVEREVGLLRVELDPGRGGIEVVLDATDHEDPLRALRVLLPGFGDADPADPWHPRYVEGLRGAGVLHAGAAWPATGDRSTRRIDDGPGTQNRPTLAVEHLAALANRLGSDLWLELPLDLEDGTLRDLLSRVHASLEPDRALLCAVGTGIQRADPAARALQRAGVEVGYHDQVALARALADRGLAVVDALADRVGSARVTRVALGLIGHDRLDRELLAWRDAGHRVDALSLIGGPRGVIGREIDAEAFLSIDRDRLLASCRAHLGTRLRELETAAAYAREYEVELVCADASPAFSAPAARELPSAARDRIAALDVDPAMRPLIVRYLERFRELSGATAVVGLQTDHAARLSDEVPAAEEWRRVPYGPEWLAVRQLMSRPMPVAGDESALRGERTGIESLGPRRKR